MDVQRWVSPAALLAASACAYPFISQVGPSLGGLRDQPLNLGTPHYYDASFADCTRELEGAMAWSVVGAQGRLEKPTTRDSAWILTALKEESWYGGQARVVEDSAVVARGFGQRTGALIRAVAIDEGGRGVAVRIIARMQYCSGHDPGAKCTTVDSESYPPVADIFASLDIRLRRKAAAPLRP